MASASQRTTFASTRVGGGATRGTAWRGLARATGRKIGAAGGAGGAVDGAGAGAAAGVAQERWPRPTTRAAPRVRWRGGRQWGRARPTRFARGPERPPGRVRPRARSTVLARAAGPASGSAALGAAGRLMSSDERCNGSGVAARCACSGGCRSAPCSTGAARVGSGDPAGDDDGSAPVAAPASSGRAGGPISSDGGCGGSDAAARFASSAGASAGSAADTGRSKLRRAGSTGSGCTGPAMCVSSAVPGTATRACAPAWGSTSIGPPAWGRMAAAPADGGGSGAAANGNTSCRSPSSARSVDAAGSGRSGEVSSWPKAGVCCSLSGSVPPGGAAASCLAKRGEAVSGADCSTTAGGASAPSPSWGEGWGGGTLNGRRRAAWACLVAGRGGSPHPSRLPARGRGRGGASVEGAGSDVAAPYRASAPSPSVGAGLAGGSSSAVGGHGPASSPAGVGPPTP